MFEDQLPQKISETYNELGESTSDPAELAALEAMRAEDEAKRAEAITEIADKPLPEYTTDANGIIATNPDEEDDTKGNDEYGGGGNGPR